jgi:hypothetical protein
MPVKRQTNGKKVKRDKIGRITKGSAPLNPLGAPKRFDSWAETIKLVGEMDGPSIAALWDTQHKEFGHLPKGITMKQLVVMTVYAALLREPSPGNWRELMDRAEGPVKEQIDLTVSEKVIEVDIEDDGHDQDTDQVAGFQ